MKKIILFFVAIAATLVSSCSYDDKPLTDRVDALDSRLTKLEAAVQKINEGIGDIKSVVEALEKGDKIVSVTPVEGGFEVVYSKAGKFTIKNGKDGADGQDGVTPVVSTKLDADGIYYWTVNGEYLLDNAGKKLPVTSHITPKVRLEGDNFEISYDNGKNWEVLGAAGSIPPGAIVINEVKDEAGAVTFVLSDGQTIVIPKAAEFALVVNEYAGAVTPGSGSTNISYELFGSDTGSMVEAFATGGFEVTRVSYTIADDPSKGLVEIKVPSPMPENGKVFIFGINSKGVTVSRVIKFEEGQFMADAMGTNEVGAEGGECMVWVNTNYDYSVSMSEDVKAWITYVPHTKALRSEIPTFIVAPNTTGKERRATIGFLRGIQTIQTFEIIQAGNVEAAN